MGSFQDAGYDSEARMARNKIVSPINVKIYMVVHKS
jgi:hypothetical protein